MADTRCRHCGRRIIKSRLGAWYHAHTELTKCEPFSLTNHKKATP